MSLLSFLLIYFILVFIFLNFLYSKLKIYYRPLTYKDKETGKIVDVHKLYEPFQSKDELKYWKFMLCGSILFPIKFTLDVILILIYLIRIRIFAFFNKDHDTNPNQFAKLLKITKF